MSNPFVRRLQAHLKVSTLTPGVFTPSACFKSQSFAAVLVGDTPVILTGAGDDTNSFNQAEKFCQAQAFKAAVAGLALNGKTTAQIVEGDAIDWPQVCEAVVGSTSGSVELGSDTGELKMISLNAYRGLTTLLCVNTELARIIDPQVPDMDDGRDLTELLKDLPQVLNLR